jgi:predicted small secreted protein
MIRNTLALIVALLALSACETMKGVGQDMQGAGRAVETEAQNTQNGS